MINIYLYGILTKKKVLFYNYLNRKIIILEITQKAKLLFDTNNLHSSGIFSMQEFQGNIITGSKVK